MKKYQYFLIAVVLWSFFSCNEKKPHLKLLKVTEYSSSKISDSSFLKVLKMKDNLDIDIDYTLSEDFALKQLSDKNVDFVIIPNNATSEDVNIKAISPLLPRVLMILTNKNVDGKSLKDILENGVVYFENRSRLDTIFFDNLFYNFNIDTNKINENDKFDHSKKTDSLSIYIGLTHLNNKIVKNLASQEWRFYSLGDIDYYGKGSKVEGFTMMNMSVKPFIIPRSFLKGKPHNSILTVSISDILITRNDISNDVIYDLSKTLFENRSRFIQLDPIYNLLDFNFDRQDLSFPLHKGTMQFIDRDEPPVWSKYVKMIWPLISISVILFGIITSLRQRLKRRKKQNIEMYYNNLLDIRAKADEAVEVDLLVTLLEELKVLRSQAMKSLANKKLDPGESFNIFLALFNDTKTELIDDIKEVRLKTQENKS